MWLLTLCICAGLGCVVGGGGVNRVMDSRRQAFDYLTT